MKTPFASSIRLPLLAGALALVVTGCGSMNGSMHRSSDNSMNRSSDNSMNRSADGSTYRANDRVYGPAGYVGQGGTPGIPPSIDPFSRSYVPFPAIANETPAITGHSVYCQQHYNQPGCQTMDSTRNSSDMRNSGRY